MTTLRVPHGLDLKGAKLWKDITSAHALGPAELVILEEACRIADRLDGLNTVLTGEAENWLDLRNMKGRGDEIVEIVIDAALTEARQQANVFKQLVAALRLPDAATGAKPQQRGGARGAYKPSAAKSAAKVSSLDAARAARGG